MRVRSSLGGKGARWGVAAWAIFAGMALALLLPQSGPRAQSDGIAPAPPLGAAETCESTDPVASISPEGWVREAARNAARTAKAPIVSAPGNTSFEVLNGRGHNYVETSQARVPVAPPARNPAGP